MSDDVAARLGEVYAALGPVYRGAVRAIADPALSTGARAVLELLEATGPRTIPQVARRLELSRQFVARSVEEAREAGLVEDRPNPEHRRSPLLALTPAGAERIAAVHAQERAALEPVVATLDAADVEACLRVLRALAAVSP